MGGASDAPREAVTVREEVRESGEIPGLACTGALGVYGVRERGTGRLVYYA